ncbi:hypothetical protein [Bradyrhizobium retamae]|uniref:hypothetical protein n=1 Tax=Bradyrhizobium retamae TaxID=1300035 RepID=UPI000B2E9CBD|nr:hypothetical protein [Bradyrhizobium retamae]
MLRLSRRGATRELSDYGTPDVCYLAEAVDSGQIGSLGLAILSYARSCERIPQPLDFGI